MDRQIHYIVEDAAQVVYEHIGRLMQMKFSKEDIIQILDLEFEYQKSIGLVGETKAICNYPITLKVEEMEIYILQKCQEIGLNITGDELEDILEKELIYLSRIGAIYDQEGFPHLN